MKTNHIRFFVCDDGEDEILYAGNSITGDLFFFDNDEGCWDKSIYPIWAILEDDDFVEVEEFSNGFISTSDALDEKGVSNSLIFCYPNQFGDLQLNIRSVVPEGEEYSS